MWAVLDPVQASCSKEPAAACPRAQCGQLFPSQHCGHHSTAWPPGYSRGLGLPLPCTLSRYLSPSTFCCPDLMW